MKRLVIKNKRKIWLWFLFLVLLILACRAAYVTGNKNMQIRDEAVEEQQAESSGNRIKWRYYVESIFEN